MLCFLSDLVGYIINNYQARHCGISKNVVDTHYFMFIINFRLENLASPVMPICMFGYHLAAEEMPLLIVDASCWPLSFSWCL